MNSSVPSLSFEDKKLLVYPPVGLVRFEGLAQMPGIEGLFLRLSPQIGVVRTDLMIPVQKAEKEGLRSLSDKKALRATLCVLREDKAVLHRMGKKSSKCKESWFLKLHSGVMADQARVLRDFRRCKEDPAYTEPEKELLAKALLLLSAEIGAILKISPAHAQKKIERLLSLPPRAVAEKDDVAGSLGKQLRRGLIPSPHAPPRYYTLPLSEGQQSTYNKRRLKYYKRHDW